MPASMAVFSSSEGVHISPIGGEPVLQLRDVLAAAGVLTPILQLLLTLFDHALKVSTQRSMLFTRQGLPIIDQKLVPFFPMNPW